jgi:hypothetical protein
VCEGSRAPFCGAEGGGYVCGGRIPEDEEFYEGADEDYDGELAEEETLGEGESSVFLSALRYESKGGRQTRVLS